MNRTLVICKPDAVERGLVGEIIGRLERKGLRLVAAELRDDRRRARPHGTTTSTRASPSTATWSRSSPARPSMVLVVEGPEDTWQHRPDLDGADQPGRGATGDHPRRSGDRADREPRPRIGLGRVGGAGDRHLLPGDWPDARRSGRRPTSWLTPVSRREPPRCALCGRARVP